MEEIAREAVELHKRKSHDYASSEDPYINFKINAQIWGMEPYLVPLQRDSEKSIRIGQLQSKKANFESIEDTLIDKVVLSMIALKLYREGK